ncbi:alpha/beta hydrolase [Lewinella sp. 4G2]|uniref:alpha/beta hydrolase n=1 Tax=Lewinella sp. 4G2 TaxID=1803372 RepID=UPI0007B4CA67|nr:alpha/beta hydrolase [Lewinella sp. 4G2]OAV45261.1 hypothetical protein A3850_012490 [Lewinella sp. 4G2]
MRTGLIVLSMLFLNSLSAQTWMSLPTGENCPAMGQDEWVSDTLFGQMLSNVAEPALLHFAPIPRMQAKGAVVVIPGGGYWVQAWDYEGVDIARHLTGAGFHVFVLKHRLPGRVALPCKTHFALDDARNGMRLVRSLADSLGFGPDKIALMGFSAGGHLAGSASVHPLEGDGSANGLARHSSRPDASILVYPVLSMDPDKSGHSGSQDNLLGKQPDAELMAYYNIPTQVNATTPPALLVHAADDQGVPVHNSIRYVEALVQHGVPADLRIYAAGGHGFGSANDLVGPIHTWLEDAVAWLKNQGW